mmetsp:Transcript_52096/g.77791  ORF Transcript_52096/g.77791 Transcript_52096/m.77791 type:complete len:187 (-) Transcript_52096:1220-1780(-)
MRIARAFVTSSSLWLSLTTTTTTMARITPTSDSSSNAASLSVPVLNELGQEVYPMDSSWSMTSRTLNNKMGKGIKQELYDNYIEGCKEAARNTEGIEEYNSCVEAETTRIHMNTNQPRGMRNYTQQGFAKIRTPEKLRLAIAEFWAQNKDKAEIEWKVKVQLCDLFSVVFVRSWIQLTHTLSVACS